MNKDDVINELGNAYQTCFKQRHGYTPGNTPALLKALPKAADICMELNADPATYVKAQERACTSTDFFATYLHSKFAKDNYGKYRDKYTSDFDSVLKVQKLYLVNAIKSGRKFESVIMDDVIDFKPWFRIIISKERNEEVIDKYRDKAMAELTSALEKFIIKNGFDIARIKKG